MKKLKSWIMIIGILTVVIGTLTGSSREDTRVHINLGYTFCDMTSAIGRNISLNLADEYIVTIHIYQDERVMLRDFEDAIVDIMLLEKGQILFDNEMTEGKLLMEFRAGEQSCAGVCVKSIFLEENLEMLFEIAEILCDEKLMNDGYFLIGTDDWIRMYLDMGYNEDRIMDYLVADFQLEAARWRH